MLLPREELLESIQNLKLKDEFNFEKCFYWTSWRFLPELLDDLEIKVGDPWKKMFNHLRQILFNANLIFFKGIHSEGWTLGDQEWIFDAPLRDFHYKWLPISEFRYSFRPSSYSFKWYPGPQPGKLLWRFEHGKN